MKSSHAINLEVIATSIDDVLHINQSDASCMELCSSMYDDGLTPSSEFITQALKVAQKPVRVMIRPRAGNFIYDADEFQQILSSIAWVERQGAQGIVIGMLSENGQVDSRMEEVLRVAGHLKVTFHRAFEQVSDFHEAYSILTTWGVDSILATAMPEILTLPQKPISIRIGGGVTETTLTDLSVRGFSLFHMGRGVRIGRSYDLPIDVALINSIMKLDHENA